MCRSNLDHGHGENTGGKTEELGLHGGEGSSASEDRDGRFDDGSTVGGGLNLSVGDLSDNSTSTGGGRGLASGGLDLSVGDLGDNSTGPGGGGLASSGLDLSVRDLSNNLGGTGGSLNLAVGDLSDLGSGGGGLNLTVGDLSNRTGRGGGSGSELAVSNLANSGGTGTENINVDGSALSALAGVVKVVEAAAQALVEDGRSPKSKGVVTTDRPAASVDGTSLDGVVKLELSVGGNVAVTTLVIGQDTVGKSDGKSLALQILLDMVARNAQVDVIKLTASRERLLLVTLTTEIWKELGALGEHPAGAEALGAIPVETPWAAAAPTRARTAKDFILIVWWCLYVLIIMYWYSNSQAGKRQ